MAHYALATNITTAAHPTWAVVPERRFAIWKFLATAMNFPEKYLPIDICVKYKGL